MAQRKLLNLTQSQNNSFLLYLKLDQNENTAIQILKTSVESMMLDCIKNVPTCYSLQELAASMQHCAQSSFHASKGPDTDFKAVAS